MLFVFRRSIYAHNTRTSRILSHRNNWYGDFGSLLSSNLFYYEKKDAVIKANCLFPVCRLCFSYQYCDLFRLSNYLPIKRQSNTCYRTFTKSYTFSIYYRNLGYGGAETNYTDDSKYTNVFTFRFYIPCCIQESSYLL